jgi:branched-chain amino acid transport system permease protein
LPSASSTATGRAPRSGFDAVLLGAKGLALVAAGILVLAFPSLAPDPFILSVGVVIASYAAYAVSWNFVGGFTGYISLGHAAYSGLGGYATALLILEAGWPSPSASRRCGCAGRRS